LCQGSTFETAVDNLITAKSGGSSPVLFLDEAAEDENGNKNTRNTPWKANMAMENHHFNRRYIDPFMVGNFNCHISFWGCTPRKTNMSFEKQWFEDVSPIEIVPF